MHSSATASSALVFTVGNMSFALSLTPPRTLRLDSCSLPAMVADSSSATHNTKKHTEGWYGRRFQREGGDARCDMAGRGKERRTSTVVARLQAPPPGPSLRHPCYAHRDSVHNPLLEVFHARSMRRGFSRQKGT